VTVAETRVHASLAVEELRLIGVRDDFRPVPHVRGRIQAATAIAPEGQEGFGGHVVARQRQRHDEALPLSG
jgi:hypothetical protein